MSSNYREVLSNNSNNGCGGKLYFHIHLPFLRIPLALRHWVLQNLKYFRRAWNDLSNMLREKYKCLNEMTWHIFFKGFIYLFLERGEGKEKEREKNIYVWLPLMHPLLGTWPATRACALTGNWTGDPLVPKLALNPQSHTSQCKMTWGVFKISSKSDSPLFSMLELLD